MAFLFGAAGYALVPAAQLRVVATAAHAPTLASATNISSFNVGVALGGWAAGEGLAAGFGWPSVTWVGAGFATVGLALVLAAAALDRRADPDRTVPSAQR
jgi:DHA1 family inner membrane transport protein